MATSHEEIPFNTTQEDSKESLSEEDNTREGSEIIEIVYDEPTTTANENEKHLNQRTTQLPRDILVAYMLCRMTGKWKELTYITQWAIFIALIGTFCIQYFVLVSLVSEIRWSDVIDALENVSADVWFNFVGLNVLFIYCIKDLFAYYHDVRGWLKCVQQCQDMQFGSDLNLVKRFKNKDVMERVQKNYTFYTFQVYFLAVFILYIGFMLYSVIEISAEKLLINKMSVGLSVFFVLEIDDWVCSLVILQTGILEDSEFDVQIIPKNPEQEPAKEIQKKVVTVMIALLSCVVFVMLFGLFSVLFGSLS